MADNEVKARTFRFPESTNKQIKDIGNLLSKNDTEVLIRAVAYLHENREAIAKSDFNERLRGLK